MVSLRRRRLLGLCSGKDSFITPLPLYCENLTGAETSSQQVKLIGEQSNVEILSQQAKPKDEKSHVLNTVVKDESGSSNVSGPPVKRRKCYSRKQVNNQEKCFMRGVYFKNMKWQAAIKVEKKQIHLGTVRSQEEAAHLYDRAAFMCGREPNSELSEEEKRELRKLKWKEFLEMTREAIKRKKN